MDPVRRQYLDAMGITVWQRRSLDPPADEAGVAQAGAEPAGEDAARAVHRMDWAALEQAVTQCTSCALHRTRNRAVFGVGDRSASWMIITKST